MNTSFGEEHLVARAQRGDDEAFAELVRRYYPRVRAILAGQAIGRATDEPAAQVFAHAARHLAEADPCRFGEWIEALAAQHAPSTHHGRVAEARAAYGVAAPDSPPGPVPDLVIAMGDYFQARRAFPSDEALAAACGVHPVEVRRLRRGELPDPATARLLGDLAPVVRRLLDHYDPAAVPDWLLGRSPDLGGRRPMDVLREGNALADVLAVIEAQTSGAFL